MLCQHEGSVWITLKQQWRTEGERQGHTKKQTVECKMQSLHPKTDPANCAFHWFHCLAPFMRILARNATAVARLEWSKYLIKVISLFVNEHLFKSDFNMYIRKFIFQSLFLRSIIIQIYLSFSFPCYFFAFSSFLRIIRVFAALTVK